MSGIAAPGAARLPGLDALRGLAVALVIARHAVPDLAPGGGVVGVVVFFTLSGYLITGVLARDAAAGRARLGAFYARRAARLVPALVVLMAGVTIVTLTLDPLGDRAALPDTLAVALTWTADLPVALVGLHPSDATFHLWTLAVEEQFYLLWPLALLLALRRGRTGTLLVVAGAACVTATVATAWWAWPEPDLAYALPTSWAGCFVAGAALRLRSDRPATRDRDRDRDDGLPASAASAPRTRRADGRLAAPVAAGVLLALTALPVRGHWWTTVAVGPLVAAATCVLLVAAAKPVPVPTVLAPLAVLGTWSYAAYLWNYPATMWLRPHVPAAGLLAAAITLPLAWASTRFVEAPALARWGRRRPPAPDPRRTHELEADAARPLETPRTVTV